MSLRARIFGAFLLVIFVTFAGVLASVTPARDALRRQLYLGGALLELAEPRAGSWRPLGEIQVLARFPREGDVAFETFRCFLNEREVTAQLTVTRHGAGGSVYPLVEGVNRLECEVFGRGWWGQRFYRDRISRELDARAPLGVDRARGLETPLDSSGAGSTFRRFNLSI